MWPNLVDVGGATRHGFQTIGKIKNLTKIPPPDNSPATTGQVKENPVVSIGEATNQGWSKSDKIAPDSPLNRTQATSDFYPRAQSGPPIQPSIRSVPASVSASATPSPGAPWSGDALGGQANRYLNPEFPDLDSAISDPKQSQLKSGPQLRPQVPPGVSWNQGTVNVGNQQQSGGNGANGQSGLRSSGDHREYMHTGGRQGEQDPNIRFVHRSLYPQSFVS